MQKAYPTSQTNREAIKDRLFLSNYYMMRNK